MDNNIDPVEFGRMLGQIAGHADDIKELKDGQVAANQKLDRLLEYQAKQRGAAHVITLIASAIAAAVGWVISWVTRGG